jgi:CHAT domain-containing protein/tetratricopeptide (TPR) repeat protein
MPDSAFVGFVRTGGKLGSHLRSVAFLAALSMPFMPLASSPVHATAAGSEQNVSDANRQLEAEINGLFDQVEQATQAGDQALALQVSRELRIKIGTALGKESQEYLSALNMEAELLGALQRNDELAEKFAEMLPLAQKLLGEKNPNTVIGMMEYGYLLQRLGRFQEAEVLFKKSWQLRQELLGDKSPDTLESLNSYSLILLQLGRLNETEPLIKKVVSLRQQVLGKQHPDTLKSMNNLAALHANLGRLSESERIQAELLPLYETVFGPNHRNTLTIMNNYAAALDDLGRVKEAAALYEKSLRLREAALGENDQDTLFSLNNYATALVKLGQAEKAVPLLAKALKIRRALFGEKHPDTLRSLNNYASVLGTLGRTEEADPLLSEALSLSREVLGNKSPQTLGRMNNSGISLIQLGKPEKGFPLLLEAFQLSREVRGDNHPETLMMADNISYLLLTTNTARDEAFEPAYFAAEGWRQRRKTLGSDARSDAQLVRQKKDEAVYFKNLTNAAWSALQVNKAREKQYRDEAFSAVQDVLAGSANRAIARSAARRAAEKSGGLGALARERQTLSDQWIEVEQKLTATLTQDAEQSTALRQKLRSQLAMTNARMTEIDAQLRKEAPDYFELIRPTSLTKEAAQGLLQSDEAALILMPTEFGTHIMVVTDKNVRWHRSSWDNSKISQAVTRLLWDVGANVDVPLDKSLEWQEEGEGAYPYDFTTAFGLYDQLITPVADDLRDKSHIFIMASGALSSLPLGILVSEVPIGMNGDPAVLRSAKWFADQHALVTIPSLQSIKFLRDRQTTESDTSDNPFLGFGNPVLAGKATTRGSGNAKSGARANRTGGFTRLFGGQTTRSGEGIANVSELKKMASLPGTAEELDAMWSAFGKPGNALYLDKTATEESVKNANLHAEVIAFATHGLLAGEVGGIAEPGLVFTPPNQATANNDGYLSMSEIAALDIDSDWIILSACNTAAGDGSDGASGLSGLARAFFYAGARKLLATNWPVRDDVAAQLTVRTIEIARDSPDFSKAQAFQRAMQEIRNDKSADSDLDTWAHPNAWAPFILVGDR